MSKNNNDKHKLTLEDRLTWHAYIEQEQIERVFEGTEADFEALLETESESTIKPIKNQRAQAHKIVKPPASLSKPHQSSELDRRTDEKLRKGKMRIDARCDLHGLNQTQAHEILNNFIQKAVLRQCRCVLVITGKGKSRLATPAAIEPERGILKQKVPEWLAQVNLRPYILKTYPAQAKDGGSGALYVYLRRHR